MGLGLVPGMHSPATAALVEPRAPGLRRPEDGIRISVFSKNLQWLDYGGMAEEAANLGFDGVDLTVRPGGHVEPERVQEDLPKAIEAVRKKGLEVYSIVTSIVDADDPLTRRTLETAAELRIHHYRMGWFHYDERTSMDENLQWISRRLKGLEELNKTLRIHGAYQNHEGHYFGAPVWDLAGILRQLNAEWTGSQYDIYHATIEGMHSWRYGFEQLAPFIKTINIKDFQWVKKNGKWATESVPLGQGAVDFQSFFSLLRKSGISCPVSIHFEYSLGGADQGEKVLSMEHEKVLDFMRKDLAYLRGRLREAGLKG